MAGGVGRRSAAGDTAQSVEDLAVEQLIAKAGVEVIAPRSTKIMSTEDKPEKPGEEKSAKWHRARAKRLREHGFTKMAEEHEQIARAIEAPAASRSRRNSAWLRARSICDGSGLRQCQNEGLNVNGLFKS